MIHVLQLRGSKGFVVPSRYVSAIEFHVIDRNGIEFEVPEHVTSIVEYPYGKGVIGFNYRDPVYWDDGQRRLTPMDVWEIVFGDGGPVQHHSIAMIVV